MRVDKVLERILEATADATAAKRRVDRYRELLFDEAKARFAAEGAAPTWKRRGLGAVRLDGADSPPSPVITDPAAYASWMAERHPSEVTARLTVPADRLAEALDALEFAGLSDMSADLEVRPAWSQAFLAGLQLDEVKPPVPGVSSGEWQALVVDEATGEASVVPGVGGNPPVPRLVVSLDAARKRKAVEEADALVEVEEGDDRAAAEATDDEPAAVPA